jgi:hypothetical protein
MIGSQFENSYIAEHPTWSSVPRLEKVTRFVSSKTFLISGPFLLLSYLLYGSTKGITVFDEGFICYQAETVLHGGIPYRDFWSTYGPGQFYLLAFLYKVFGPSLLVGRIYHAVIQWLIVLLSYGISRRLSGPVGAAASCITVGIWLAFDRTVLYPVVPALMFSLMGFWVTERFPATWRRNFLAGVLMGCCALMRHDMGVYGFAALLVLILGRNFRFMASNANQSSSTLTHLSKQFFPYLSGFLVVVVPVLIVLVWTVPYPLLYQTFVAYPFHAYSQYRSIPFPVLQDVGSTRHGSLTLHFFLHIVANLTIFGLPLLIPIVTAIFVCIQVRREPKDFLLGIAILVFEAGVWYSAWVRPDYGHIVAPMVVSLILFPWLLHLVMTLKVTWPIKSLLGLFVLSSVAILSLECLFQANLGPLVRGDKFYPLEIERAEGISITKDESTTGLADAVRYVRDRVAPQELIFVGNSRHDRLVCNATMFYFLSARKSATRYSELDPGIATTGAVQSEIVNELTTHRVRYIVIWTASQSIEPNLSSRSDSTILDEFIRANYKQVAELGFYSVLYRPGISYDSDNSGRHL